MIRTSSCSCLILSEFLARPMPEPDIPHTAHFACSTHLACCLLSLLFDPENGGSMFFQNVGKHLPDYTESYPRREYFSFLHYTYQNMVLMNSSYKLSVTPKVKLHSGASQNFTNSVKNIYVEFSDLVS
jgi:hypothetical protein